MTGLVEKAWTAIARHAMLPAQGPVVLGVSGGPDSLALMHVVEGVCRRFHAGTLAVHVGHLHHGMRGTAADEDADFVRAQCDALGFSFTVEHADVPSLARARRVGEEVAGRRARYAFLARLAARLGASRILLGHHADDQAETVLMRLMRGAGPRGMGGIPCIRAIEGNEDILVARPLLDCTRAEIEEFLAERGLAGRLDSTNLSDRYLRNRIRQHRLPAFDREWGGRAREDLCRFAAACQRFDAAARIRCDRLLVTLNASLQPGWVEIPLNELRAVPAGLRAEFFRHALARAGLERRMLDQEHLARLGGFAAGDKKSLSLPGGIVAEFSCGLLCLYAPEDWGGAEFETDVRIPGRTLLPPLGAVIEAKVFSNRPDMLEKKIARDDSDEAVLDHDRLSLPLRARFRRAGDRMQPLGAPGTRKLKDLFNDLRVPRSKRDRVPVVVDASDRIIWLAGHRIAQYAAIGEKTQTVLRLRLER